MSNVLRETKQELSFHFLETKKLSNSDFYIKHFYYKHKSPASGYGLGFELYKSELSTPLWFYFVPGDFGPHSISLIDFNNDGLKDLFFYEGFEDVLTTRIFLANYTTQEYDFENFIEIYSNLNDYSVLTDLDKDGIPEILDSGYTGDVNRSGLSCFENGSWVAILDENRVSLSDSLRKIISIKYFDQSSGFIANNFNYGMLETSPVFNSFLMSPIKIYSLKSSSLVNMTSTFKSELNWRIQILEQIKKDSSDNCEPFVERRIRYLTELLKK